MNALNVGRHFVNVLRTLVFACVTLSLSAYAQSGPTKLNISGGLYNPNGTAVLNSAVNFRIEIWDKNATCVLYSEEHSSIDLSASKGGFALQVGSGSNISNRIDGSSATALSSLVFKNSGVVAPFLGCASGVTLNAGDERLIRVHYDLGGGFVAMSPDVPVTSSAYAMVSETLQGKGASEFIQVRDDATYDLNQTNIESIFSAVNFAKLVQILSGNWGNTTLTNVGTPSAGTDATNKSYVDANIGGKIADVTTVGPAAGNGHTLIWDQALNRWVTGVPSATDNTKLPLTGGTMTGAIAMGAQNITNIGHMTMAAQRTLNLGTYDDTQEGVLVGTLGAVDKGKIWFNSQSNVFKVWNGTAAVSTFGASGAAGGDLTGTYPNPDIATGVVGSTELTDGGIATIDIANDAIMSAKINNTGIAVNRLLMTDATTGATVGYKTCALDETLKWTATGWACSTAAAFIGNTGVTAATYGNATQVSQVQVDAQGRIVTASNVNIGFPVVSVAGKTGAVTLNTADISGLGTAAVKDFGTAAGNLVELDGGGKIPASLLPSSTGDIGDVIAGSGLTGGGSTGAVTLSVDTGVTTGKIIQVAASDKLPAIDGSNLTQVNAVKLQARDVASTAPTAAQVLTWNAASSAWEPQTVSIASSGGFINGGNSFGATATLGTNDNFALNLEANGATALTILPSGSVGIGTATPTHTVTVMGNLAAIASGSGPSTISQQALSTDASRPTAAFRRVRNDTTPPNAMIGTLDFDLEGFSNSVTTTASSLAFGWEGNQIDDVGARDAFVALSTMQNNVLSERFRINSSGNVGIGTTNPQSLLHVNGVVRATDICDENGANCKDISGGWGGGGDIDGVYTSTGLTGGFASGSGTLSVDVGTTTGKIVQIAASDKLPALDGSNLTAVNAVALQSRQVSATAPTANQILTWNAGNSTWEPTTSTTVSSQWVTAGSHIHYSTGNVGIGTASPASALHVMGAIRGNNGSGNDLVLQDGSGNIAFRSVRTSHWTDLAQTQFFQIGNTSDNVAFTAQNGSRANRLMMMSSKTQVSAYSPYISTVVPSGIFEVVNSSNSQVFLVSDSGNVGIGSTSPTAALQIKAGTATASTAPLKFTAGTNLTTPENGAVEYDGTDLFLTSGGTRRKLTQSSISNDLTGINSITGSGALPIATGGTNNALTLTSTGTTGAVDIFAGTASGNINLNPGTTGVVNVNSTVASTSSTTGSLIVDGGVGIAGALNVGNGISFNGLLYNGSGVYMRNSLGTAATPAYAFNNGAADTGLFLPLAQTIAISTAGTERVRVSSSGNVGIGTTTPNSILQISTAATPILTLTNTVGNDSKIRMTNGSGTYEMMAIDVTSNQSYIRADNNLYLQTSGSTRMTVGDTSGFVGIGTTTPTEALDVAGTIRSSTGGIMFPDGSVMTTAAGTTSGNSSLTDLNFAADSDANGTGDTIFSSNGLERMRIANNGKIGFGVSAPTGQVQVQNPTYITDQFLLQNGTTSNPPAYPGGIVPSFVVQSSQTTNSRPLFFGYQSGASWAGHMLVGACTSFSAMCLNLSSGSTNRTALRNNGTTLQIGGGTGSDGNFTDVQFGNSGNVGIGTATPGAKLDVVGTVSATVVGAAGGTVGAPSHSFTGDLDSGFYSPAANNIAASTNAIERLRITQDGNVGIGTTTPGTMLTVNGPIAPKGPSTINAATYTVAASDSSLIFTTTNCTLTLPAASAFPGRILYVKNISANSVDSASADVVPLASAVAGTTILSATPGKFAMLQSDGTNWVVMMAN